MNLEGINQRLVNNYDSHHDVYGVRATYNSISQKIIVNKEDKREVDHSFNIKEIHSVYNSGNEKNDSDKYFANKQKRREVEAHERSFEDFLGKAIDILI